MNGQVKLIHSTWRLCVPSSRAGCRCQGWCLEQDVGAVIGSNVHLWCIAMVREDGPWDAHWAMGGTAHEWELGLFIFRAPSDKMQEMSILKVGMFWIEWLQDKGNVTGHYGRLKEFWLWAKCCPTRPLIHIVTAAELMPRNIYFWNFCFTSIIHFNVGSSS